MTNEYESRDEVPKDQFQVQKIFITNLSPFDDFCQDPKKIYMYFSLFGQIIDIKVLKNRCLKRKERCLRLHDFQRRNNSN